MIESYVNNQQETKTCSSIKAQQGSKKNFIEVSYIHQIQIFRNKSEILLQLLSKLLIKFLRFTNFSSEIFHNFNLYLNSSTSNLQSSFHLLLNLKFDYFIFSRKLSDQSWKRKTKMFSFHSKNFLFPARRIFKKLFSKIFPSLPSASTSTDTNKKVFTFWRLYFYSITGVRAFHFLWRRRRENNRLFRREFSFVLLWLGDFRYKHIFLLLLSISKHNEGTVVMELACFNFNNDRYLPWCTWKYNGGWIYDIHLHNSSRIRNFAVLSVKIQPCHWRFWM